MRCPYNPKQFYYIITGFASISYIIYFSTLAICKFNNFDPSCYQIGWISYSAWNFFTHGSFQFYTMILPKLPMLSFFMPIFFLCFFLPPSPEILMILQNTIIIFTVIPLYLLVNHLLKSRSMALVFSLTFFLHPIVHLASVSGFTPEIIALPLLMFAFYYFEKGNLNKSLIFILLSSTCRISILIMSLLWGLYLFFSGKNKKFGKIVFFITLAWLLSSLTLLFFLGHRQSLGDLLHLEQYGNNLQNSIQKLSNTPSILLQNALSKKNLDILLNVLLPFAFTPLLQPILLVPLTFSFAYIFFLHNNTAELCFILPFIYLSAIYGVKKILNWTQHKQKLKYTLAVFLIIFSLISFYYLRLPWHGSIPLSKNTSWDYYKITKHNKLGHEFLKLIPQKASVIAQYPFDQHLTFRTKLDIFNKETVKNNWEFILLDISAPSNFLTPPDYKSIVEHLLKNNSYQTVAQREGWLLLKRVNLDQ